MAMIVRKVTKRVYDKYTSTDYNLISTDNLNPTSNTQLESQFNEILGGVKNRILNAYESLGIEPDDNLTSIDVPTVEGLQSALDNLERLYNKNPLIGLVENQGLSIEAGQLTPFLEDPDDGDEVFNKPFKLNCEGVSPLGKKDEFDIEEEDEEDPLMEEVEVEYNPDEVEKDDSGANTATPEDPSKKTYNITYVFDSTIGTNPSSNPTTYTKDECPKNIAILQITNNNYKFKGWYFDEAYNTKLTNNKLHFKGKDITLYAKVDLDSGNGSEEEEEDFDNSLPPGANANPDCPELELSWLRIILIVLKIIKILIQVFVTMLNIAKAAAAIAKDAQLCWINPPCLASLISYCLQRVSAIIFQIVAMLLLYLWSLLNFDCISATSVDLVNQINATLAGLSSTFGAVEATAIEFGETKNAWKEAIDHLKNDLTEQVEDLKNKWTDPNNYLGDIGGAWSDFTDMFTDPHKLYSNAVPAEIRGKVNDVITSVKNIKSNATQVSKSYNSMVNAFKGEKPQQDNKSATYTSL